MALRKCIEHIIEEESPKERCMKKGINLDPMSRPALTDIGNNTDSNLNGYNGIIKKTSSKPSCPLTKVGSMKKEKDVTENGKNVKMLKDENIVDLPESYSSRFLHIVNADKSIKNDPQLVTEYAMDIFNYLRELECKYPIKENYLEGHKCTSKIRLILVNWLMQIHINFKFYLETLHLCVAIIDRYLQRNKNVGKETLQLVGSSAMFIAAKYEEIYIPDIKDFVYICDNAFSKRQILQMECHILKNLDFSLGRPLPIHFLRRYNRIAQVRNEHHSLGKYLLELALLEYNICHIRPSIQAAAACCLAIAILNEVLNPAEVWTPLLVTHTTYGYSDFKLVLVDMAHMILNAKTAKYQTVQKKYSLACHNKISLHYKLHGLLIKKLTLPMIKKQIKIK